MKKNLNFLWIFLMMGILMSSGFVGQLSAGEPMHNASTPKYLYKILSVQAWKESQSLDCLILSKEDSEFIHLATEEQLDRIANKFWSNVPEYVVLKIEAVQLQGNLAFEANQPGGNQYYHLYKGVIPLKSVVEAKIVK